MSLYALIVFSLSLVYVLCLQCVKYVATNTSIKYKFNKQSSNKCTVVGFHGHMVA